MLYESPYRIKKLLSEIGELLGDIDVFLSRELTKIHEELLSGTVSQVLQGLGDQEVLGEVTLILAPSQGKTP